MPAWASGQPRAASILLGHTPLRQEVVPVVVLDAGPDVVEEEGKRRVQHDVAVEVLVRLVEHASVVAGVDIVTPTVLCGVDVDLRHALHAHLLEVPVALQPADPVPAGVTAKPNACGAQPEVNRTALVRRHHGLLDT